MGSTGLIRVLLVEEDPRVRTSVRDGLEQLGCAVADTATGADALTNFPHIAPQVAIIDLMLLGNDGLELCRRLRAISDVPIIINSARSNIASIIEGLEAGADDYMVKPIDINELHARIRALLRRVATSVSSSRQVFGELDIRPDEGRVLRQGVEVKVTKTEFKLLCELAAAPDKVFTRELLLDRVWGYGHFGDGRLVDVHIRRLRTKIESDPANPRHVVTVRGLGYRLERNDA